MIFLNFNTIGIICEYNPFHFGHKYHIAQTRLATGCQNIVCVMSGSMVQRGECAIFSKWQRAKMAIDAGADLVIELPAYYVLQSADIFAKGAVKILDGMGVVDGISFGCECGNIEIIRKIANVMTDEGSNYNIFVKNEMKKGLGFPKASENALLKCLPDIGNVISKPNNTLAVSYVKSIIELNSKLTPFCIKRDNDYHSEKTNDNYLSASEIRNRIKNDADYKLYSPDYSSENIFELKNAESFILGYLRLASLDEIACTKGGEDGLANLVKNSALKACTLEDLFEMCVNKRYTLHRIKRYILSVILGINYVEDVNYLRVLAVGKNGREILKSVKEKSEFTIVTKVADYKENSKMFETDIKATDFAYLCSNDVSKRIAGKDYITTPYIK